MSFYSEVVPPGSVLEDENGIPEVIPIKSWAHGSPVKGGLRSGRIDSQLLITPRDENSYDTEGMLHYIPKDPDAEHDDDGGSAEDEEVDMENHPTEEDDEQEADEEQYEDDFKNDDEYDDLLNYLEEEEANEEGWERDKNPYDYQQTNHLNYTSAVTQKMGDHLSHFHADLECNYDDADDDLNNFEESQSQGEYEESEGSDREDNASPQFKFDETAYNAMVSAADDVIRKMSPRFQKFLKEDENDDDNDSNSSGSHQDHLMDIMSEYNELVSYLESPRGEEVKTKELNTGYKSPEKQQLIGKLIDAANTYLSDRKPKQKKAKATVKKSDSTKGNPVAGSSKNKPNYADKGQQKSDKIVSRMADLVDKGGLYVADSAKPKQKPPVNRGKSDAGEKHKQMLADLVEKRRLEEEELIQQTKKAEAKRKKFKEALLERAMKAREASNEQSDREVVVEIASKPKIKKKVVIVDTVSKKDPQYVVAKLSKISSAKEIILTDEDLKRQEEEKREQIAQIRRKFKEQHKRILMTLLQKNKELEKKAEDDQQKEKDLLEKRKRKTEKLLEAKRGVENTGMRENAEQIPVRSSKSAEQSSGVSEGLDNHFSEMAHPRSNSSGTGQVNVQNVAKAGRRAVGSGLAAVRHRSQSFSVETAQGGKIKSNRSKSTEESDLDMVPEGDSQDAERKQASKLQQTKVVAYLLALTEQRKKEELEKKKREERSKRRMELLSARLLQEAAERKLMSGEDNVKHQLQAPTSTATDTKPPRKNLPPKVPKEKTKASNSSKIVAENEAGSQKTVKLSPEMEEAIVARLQTKKSKSDGNADPYNVPARDFSDWKRKNSVPQDAKVFSMTGWYPCVKQALLDRGWYFNSDTTSPHFDLKWTLRSIDVSQETLQPWQLTNHYLKNVAITTKVGLIKSLQSLVWLADVDSKDLIPRAYDLSLAHEMQAFIDDYRFQKAEAIVRTVYKAICGQAYPVVEFTTGTVGTIIINTAEMEAPSHASGGKPNQEDSYGEDSLDNLIYPSMPPVKADIAIDSIQINPVIFEAACTILENHLKPLEDSYIDDPSFDSSKLVTDLHWELINNYDVFTSYKNLPYDVPEPVDSFLREKTENDPKLQSMELKELKRRLRKEQEDREEASNEICTVRSSKLEDLARIHKILCDLQKYNQGQFGINSAPDAINGNLWIVKPAAKSRGRGIATFADLPKLLKYVEAGSGYSTQWIVQKYMENPLCIANRKFDLRQWVLVTSWNPLTLYFYDEFYARFSVEEYSTLDSDLENSFVHLVNNSIGKNSENFDKQVVAENGEAIDGFMWSFNSFREYVKYKNNGEDLVKTKIQPRMKEIAKCSLMCASEMIEHRKNSWELYGFDYMIDANYNAWLIEINSSPACDYSTKVTERYVQKALVELLSVVLDCREWESQPKKTRGEQPDTYGWENIYHGPLLDTPVAAFGTDMTLKGEAMKGLPKRAVPLPNRSLGFVKKCENDGDVEELTINGKNNQTLRSFNESSIRSNNSEKLNIVPRSRSTEGSAIEKSTRLAETSNALGGTIFDDSDDDNSPTKSSKRLATLEESTKGRDARGGNKKIEIEKTGLSTKNTTPSVAGSAIPIKVFNVEF